MRKVVRTLVAVLAVALAAGVASAQTAAVGAKAPAITLQDTAKAPVALEDLVKKKAFTVLTFTNSACRACRDEMKALNKLKEEAGNAQFVAVITDMSGEAGATKMKEMFGETFTYLLDPEFSSPPAFGFQFTPALVVLDKEYKVKLLKGGYEAKTAAAFKDEVLAALK